MVPATDVERIADLLYTLESRLGEKLTPQWAARTSAWSLAHFHRKFRAISGESFQGYLRGRKLHRAAEDLLGTGLPIECIASGADFAHVPAFYKAFLQRYGVTPAAYRRSGQDLWYLGREALPPAFLGHLHQGMIDGEPKRVLEPGRLCTGVSACGGWSDFDGLFRGFRADLKSASARPDRIHLYLCASREDLVERRLTVHIGVETGRLERPPLHWQSFAIPGGPCAEFRHQGGSHAYTCYHIWRHWRGRGNLLPFAGYAMEMEWDGTNPFSGRRPMIFQVPIDPSAPVSA